MENVSLVLEGGGLRGLYTSAILDYFVEKGLDFKYVVGVSAGAIMAASYFSGQIERNLRINTTYLSDPRYMSFRNVIKEGAFFSKEFAYRKVPNELEKFDYDEFYKKDFVYNVGAFDCKKGENTYFNLRNVTENEKFLDIIMASASLPFLSKPVDIDGNIFLDGGIGESIPIYKSMEDGKKKHVIILTRDESYRKKEREDSKFIRLFYRNYPKVAEQLISRGKRYNKTLDYLRELEKEGKVFIIRPSSKVEVARLEKNPEKIKELYTQGRDDIEKVYEDLVKFLEK